MALFRPTYTDKKTKKQRKSRVWWYEFVYAGQRIRESAKTTRKTIATEAEKRRRLELERAMAGLPIQEPESRIASVRDVLKTYSKDYPVNHRQKSVLVVENRSVHLNRILGSCLLPDLTPDRIVDYMRQRQKEEASGRTINIEISVLARAMGRTWKFLWPKVAKLEENHDVGRALEPEEEKSIMETARKNRSPLIYPFLQVLAWTGMRSDEARVLKWSQVDFEAGQIVVGKSKTEAGVGRVIPMSGALRSVLEQYAGWYARKLGPIEPEWHVFPASNRIRPTNPSEPVTSLKRAWESVREKSGITCRLHDFRHSFCTRMAEASVAESTMLDIMGHVSSAMLRRYSHIRSQARRDAITAVEARSNGVLQEVPKVTKSENAKVAVTH